MGKPLCGTALAAFKPPGQIPPSTQSPVTLFSSSVVILKPGLAASKAASRPHKHGTVLTSQQAAAGPSRYTPVIEELPPDAPQSTGSQQQAQAKLPPTSRMVIDIDSDDDKDAPTERAANSRVQQSTQRTYGTSQQLQAGIEPEPLGEFLFADSDHAGPARQVHDGLKGQTSARLSGQVTGHSRPAQHPAADITKQAAGSAMGDIFTSFSAFDDMSDEEEEAGAAVAAPAQTDKVLAAAGAVAYPLSHCASLHC